MHVCRKFAFAVALLAAPVASAQGPDLDWPQWRGPTRTGTITSLTIPAVWPERLTRRWTVDVGDGYAAPVIVGDHVYMFTRQGTDETMTALDAETGTEVWQTRYAAPFSFDSAADPHGPGPKATPTFSDGTLYTLGIGGAVTAFNATTGRQSWQVASPPVGPLYGTAVSPLVEQGSVIVHVGGHDDGALTAFDAKTGAVRWAWSDDGPSYASPLATDLGGTRQIVTLTQNYAIGVEASTGTLLWQWPFATGYAQNTIDPIVVDDTIIIAGFEEPTAAFRVMHSDGRWTTDSVWTNPDISLYMANGIVVEESLFGLSQRNSGQYFLLDLFTGRTSWTSPGRQAENAAMVGAREIVFVLEDDAELIVGRVRPTGFEELRRYDVGMSPTWAQPAVSGNRVFIKDRSTLTLWTF